MSAGWKEEPELRDERIEKGDLKTHEENIVYICFNLTFILFRRTHVGIYIYTENSI